MAIELGRTWCVGHGHRRFARLLRQQQCLIGMLVRGGRRHHEPHYGAVSVCVEGTTSAGGWIRRRRRRATGCRRAGKRRIELSLNKNFVFQFSTASCKDHFVFWDEGEGEPIGIECQREQVQRTGPRELMR